jgi:carbamoyltransferase
VGLNCLANGRVLREAGFRRVFVPPGCGDGGGAIGAALFLSSLLGEKPLPHEAHAYWGPGFLDREIERELKAARLPYRRLAEAELVAEASARLGGGRVLGWFQGAMEFGPRALGHRSILASPVAEAMKDRVNEIKRREKFRPFAPVVPLERAGELFELEGESPFMLFAVKVREEKRGRLAAITHVDGTARVQTLARGANPLLHSLLEAMEPRIGVPALLNTSFNLDSEPVVCTPADAVRCFVGSSLDGLVIGPFLAEKAGPPA